MPSPPSCLEQRISFQLSRWKPLLVSFSDQRKAPYNLLQTIGDVSWDGEQGHEINRESLWSTLQKSQPTPSGQKLWFPPWEFLMEPFHNWVPHYAIEICTKGEA